MTTKLGTMRRQQQAEAIFQIAREAQALATRLRWELADFSFPNTDAAVDAVAGLAEVFELTWDMACHLKTASGEPPEEGGEVVWRVAEAPPTISPAPPTIEPAPPARAIKASVPPVEMTREIVVNSSAVSILPHPREDMGDGRRRFVAINGMGRPAALIRAYSLARAIDQVVKWRPNANLETVPIVENPADRWAGHDFSSVANLQDDDATDSLLEHATESDAARPMPTFADYHEAAPLILERVERVDRVAPEAEPLQLSTRPEPPKGKPKGKGKGSAGGIVKWDVRRVGASGYNPVILRCEAEDEWKAISYAEALLGEATSDGYIAAPSLSYSDPLIRKAGGLKCHSVGALTFQACIVPIPGVVAEETKAPAPASKERGGDLQLFDVKLWDTGQQGPCKLLARVEAIHKDRAEGIARALLGPVDKPLSYWVLPALVENNKAVEAAGGIRARDVDGYEVRVAIIPQDEQGGPLVAWRRVKVDALKITRAGAVNLHDAGIITAGEAWDKLAAGELADLIGQGNVRSVREAVVVLRAEMGDPVAEPFADPASKRTTVDPWPEGTEVRQCPVCRCRFPATMPPACPNSNCEYIGDCEVDPATAAKVPELVADLAAALEDHKAQAEDSPAVEEDAEDPLLIDQLTHEDHDPTHPWYYKLGGVPIAVEDIPIADANDSRSYWKQRAREDVRTAKGSTRQQKELVVFSRYMAEQEQHIRRYREIVAKGWDALSPSETNRGSETTTSDLDVALSLKYSHISVYKAKLAGLAEIKAEPDPVIAKPPAKAKAPAVDHEPPRGMARADIVASLRRILTDHPRNPMPYLIEDGADDSDILDGLREALDWGVKGGGQYFSKEGDPQLKAKVQGKPEPSILMATPGRGATVAGPELVAMVREALGIPRPEDVAPPRIFRAEEHFARNILPGQTTFIEPEPPTVEEIRADSFPEPEPAEVEEAHAKPAGLVMVEAPAVAPTGQRAAPADVDNQLLLALHKREGMAARWDAIRSDTEPATDEEISAAVGRAFDLGVDFAGVKGGAIVDQVGGVACCFTGGKTPKFWANRTNNVNVRPTLESRPLVERVRIVLELPGLDGKVPARAGKPGPKPKSRAAGAES